MSESFFLFSSRRSAPAPLFSKAKKKCFWKKNSQIPLERLPDCQVPHEHGLLPLEQAQPPGRQGEGGERGEGDEEGARREGWKRGRRRRSDGSKDLEEPRREPRGVEVPGRGRERARHCGRGDRPEQAPRGVERGCVFWFSFFGRK